MCTKFKTLIIFLLISVLTVFQSQIGFTSSQTSEKTDIKNQEIVNITGIVHDVNKIGVPNVFVYVFLNDDEMIEPVNAHHGHSYVETDEKGNFLIKFNVEKGKLEHTSVKLKFEKPSFKSIENAHIKNFEHDKNKNLYIAYQDITIERTQGGAFWLAAIILLLVYVVISLELLHRTHTALLGGSLILFITYTAGTLISKDFFILSFEDAIKSIDLNVVFLLMGMMLIIGVMRKTGVFQWFAYKSYHLARGNIFLMGAILWVITAVLSAFLDNVTTILLIIPITMEICKTLKIEPIAILIPEVFASNVGGTATLIGDPPNIMIGSYAKLSFMDFVINLTPVVIFGLIFTVLWYLWWYKKDLSKAVVEDYEGLLKRLKEEYKITNKKLLFYSLFILSLVVTMFVFHGELHMEPSIAAMIGAAVLLLMSGESIVESLEKEVEWPTLMFFIFLFIIVGAAEETGLIQLLANGVRDLSQGDLFIAVTLILWVSAIASAIVDNIPFTATMLPVVAFLTVNAFAPVLATEGVNPHILWWALAFGACLGGNGTMVGASANVVMVGMAEKAGYQITFMRYFRAVAIPTVITLGMAMVWLILVEM